MWILWILLPAIIVILMRVLIEKYWKGKYIVNLVPYILSIIVTILLLVGIFLSNEMGKLVYLILFIMSLPNLIVLTLFELVNYFKKFYKK